MELPGCLTYMQGAYIYGSLHCNHFSLDKSLIVRKLLFLLHDAESHCTCVTSSSFAENGELVA